MNRTKDETYSDAETARRRDEVIRRMANTPPQPRTKSPDHHPKKKRSAVQGQKPRGSGKDRA